MVIAAAGGAFSVGIGHAGATVRPLVFISGGPPRACIDFRVINSPDRSTQLALLSWRESAHACRAVLTRSRRPLGAAEAYRPDRAARESPTFEGRANLDNALSLDAARQVMEFGEAQFRRPWRSNRLAN